LPSACGNLLFAPSDVISFEIQQQSRIVDSHRRNLNPVNRPTLDVVTQCGLSEVGAGGSTAPTRPVTRNLISQSTVTTRLTFFEEDQLFKPNDMVCHWLRQCE